MAVTIVGLIGLAIVGYFAWINQCYLKNKQIASEIGLPIVSSSLYEMSFIYSSITASSWFRSIVKNAPQFVLKWSELNRHDWRWDAKTQFHRKLGGVFLVVNSSCISMEVADPTVVREILDNRDGFPNYICPWLLETSSINVPSVPSTGSETYYEKRRPVTPAYNEKNYNRVWKETITQTKGLIAAWKENPAENEDGWVLNNTREDFRKLALRVITGAAYGMPVPYDMESREDKTVDSVENFPFNPMEPIPEVTTQSWFEAISVVTREYSKLLVYIRAWPVCLRNYAPEFLKNALDAYHDLGFYLEKLIIHHKSQLAPDTTKSDPSLIETIVHGPDEHAENAIPKLTHEEIRAKAFIGLLAGHETMAASLEYALLLLALFPGPQKWACKELSRNVDSVSRNEEYWEYRKVFPKLASTFAVMNETMRLYPPPVLMAKETVNRHQHLEIYQRCRHLPARLRIVLNPTALHYNKKFWGNDAAEFRPQRWMPSDDCNPLTEYDTGRPSGYPDIVNPKKGIFLPTSEGLTACFGQKFDKVEFVVALAMILKDYFVELLVQEGEDIGVARANALDRLADSRSRMSLGMVQSTPLLLRKRKKC